MEGEDRRLRIAQSTHAGRYRRELFRVLDDGVPHWVGIVSMRTDGRWLETENPHHFDTEAEAMRWVGSLVRLTPLHLEPTSKD